MSRPMLHGRASTDSIHSMRSVRSTRSIQSIQSVQSTTSTVTVTDQSPPPSQPLQPCAASSSLFLFAQGPSVVCVQHDTLQLVRRFENHEDDVTLVAVDVSGDENVGRVVSIDASRQAIVWDYKDGDEIVRFNPFEEIRVAAWMRNGNLSCGDVQGNVILFDPSQSESILARTTGKPLCALAPSADCKTFALGYENGSILVASLVPFTIIHTLTVSSLSPSPIASLAWHASSSKQNSDMLATQTVAGDLRVWVVGKTVDSGEPAKVVRILTRPEGNTKGKNWCAWSMKGRVLQFSGSATTIWDVRNKKVECEQVPTPENLAGISVWGPKGVLFTVDREQKVQQYKLYPPEIVASTQYPLATEPQPELQRDFDRSEIRFTPQLDDEYNAARMSPLGRIAHELEQLERMEAQGLGISGAVPPSRSTSISSATTSRSTNVSRRPSVASIASTRSGRSMSTDSRDDLTAIPRSRQNSITNQTFPSPGRRPAHPLAQQYVASPIDAPRGVDYPLELFSGLKARMANVTYSSPRLPSSAGGLKEDDLRREMLFAIFGWRGDVDTLIRDALDSVDSRSMTAVLLRMWLGELDQNSLTVLLGLDFQVSADWFFLALSAMDGKKSWDTVARAMVMHLVGKGDIHTGAALLLALGNAQDAIDLYISHNRHMEAVIFAAYIWKNDWKKLSQLVRKWGEHAMANQQSELATRCFACAGTEPPEDIQSPLTPVSHKRMKSDSDSVSSFIKNIGHAASPSNIRHSLMPSSSKSPLKLITTFPSPSAVTEAPQLPVKPQEKESIAKRFFNWAGKGDSAKSPIGTPIQRDPVIERDWGRSNSFPKPAPPPQKLPAVTETPTPQEETPKQRFPTSGLPYETRLDIPPQVLAAAASKSGTPTSANTPTSSTLNISSPMGNSEQGGQTPSTLGEQISRGNTPAARPDFNEGIFQSNTPSVSPKIGSGEFASPRSSSTHRGRTIPVKPPAGLQIHWPAMDGILHGDVSSLDATVKGARPSASASNLRSASRRRIDGDLHDIDESAERRSRSRRREGSPDRRGRSYSRRPGAREASIGRSRSTIREDEDETDDFDADEEYRGRAGGQRRGQSAQPPRSRQRSSSRGRARSRSVTGTSTIREVSHDEGAEHVSDLRSQSRVRARSVAKLEPRAMSRIRGESRPRAPSRLRNEVFTERSDSRSRVPRASSPPRSESRYRGAEWRAHQESRMRAESRARRESPPPRGESPPRGRERGSSQVRAESRQRVSHRVLNESPDRARSRMRSGSVARAASPPRASSRYRGSSRAPEERGRSALRAPNMMRSPSSPLPTSQEANNYRYDDDDFDEDVGPLSADVYRPDSMRRDESRVRAGSRVRGLRDESRARGRDDSRVRGGREESRVRGDREQSRPRLGRDESRARSRYREESRPRGRDARPGPTDDEEEIEETQTATEYGLPSHPRAWKGSISRTNSPAPSMARGRSPAPQRSPLNSPPVTANSIDMNLSPRTVHGRAMSPSPSMLGARGRSASRGPVMGLPSGPTAARSLNQFSDSDFYNDRIPDVPRIPDSARSPSVAAHGRNTSISTKPIPAPIDTGKQFYPTPKVQVPGSPPPLPVDMPVHPALQAHLTSSQSRTRDRSVPRNPAHDRARSVTRGRTESPTRAMMISIGMSPRCLEEEERQGKLSPGIPNLMNGRDPRMGTPL